MVIRESKRLLSWQDREPFSKTYGSFDRTYWGWKFTDFPGARFQEGIYALAYLFSYSFPDNLYYNSERVLEWAKAGIKFSKIFEPAVVLIPLVQNKSLAA